MGSGAGEAAVATLPLSADGWRLFNPNMHYYCRGAYLCGSVPYGDSVPFFNQAVAGPPWLKLTNWRPKCKECDEKHTAMWCGPSGLRMTSQ